MRDQHLDERIDIIMSMISKHAHPGIDTDHRNLSYIFRRNLSLHLNISYHPAVRSELRNDVQYKRAQIVLLKKIKETLHPCVKLIVLFLFSLRTPYILLFSNNDELSKFNAYRSHIFWRILIALLQRFCFINYYLIL